ncbi:hypothetical protein RTBOTA2_006958 [Rhodotorula toruloides]|nr:hypothetical protein RTBOTA2_006958 [Rhodotorula toruloides]
MFALARIQHSDNSVPKAKNFNSASDRLPNGKLSDYSPDLQRLIQDLLEDQPYLRPSQLNLNSPQQMVQQAQHDVQELYQSLIELV